MVKKNWKKWIDKIVVKHNNKQFLNGKYDIKIKDLVISEFSGKEVFLLEDDTTIDCYQVKLK